MSGARGLLAIATAALAVSVAACTGEGSSAAPAARPEPTPGASLTEPPSGAGPTDQPGRDPGPPSAPHTSPSPPLETGPLDEYRQRCLSVTKGLSPAVLAWDPRIETAVGKETAVDVVLSLDTGIPPNVLIPSADATAAPVLVACRITGSLIWNSDVFSLASSTPSVQTLVILNDMDAAWRWLVTPRASGQYELYVKLEPVVTLGSPDVVATEAALPYKIFKSSVEVRRSADEAIGEAADRGTRLVGKMTALITAAGLLLAAVLLTRRRWARLQQADDAEPADDEKGEDSDSEEVEERQ